MITIQVKERRGVIHGLHISGHAKYAPIGEDIVCAGVSAIGIGLLNALNQLCETTCDLHMTEDIHIQVNEINEVNQTILKTGLIQLAGLETGYQLSVQIKKQEV